jgi:hypothetical protein
VLRFEFRGATHLRIINTLLPQIGYGHDAAGLIELVYIYGEVVTCLIIVVIFMIVWRVSK